jgi:hypothetical protein
VETEGGHRGRLKRATDGVDIAEARFNRMRGEFLKQAPAVFDLLGSGLFIVETYAVAPILCCEAGIAADPRNQRTHGRCSHSSEGVEQSPASAGHVAFGFLDAAWPKAAASFWAAA